MHALSAYSLVALVLSSTIPLVASQQEPPPACASSAKTCASNLKSPSPKGVVCAKTGILKTPALLAPSFQYTSIDNCRSLCLSDPKCLSFSWNTSNGQCLRYSKGLGEMGFTAASSSTANFFGRSCYTFSCETVTKTVTNTETVTASPTANANAGFSLGFGAGYVNDPLPARTYNFQSGAVPRDPAFCASGDYCKVLIFSGTGRGQVYVTMSFPLQTANGGNYTFVAKYDHRRLYQASQCLSDMGLAIFDANGNTVKTTQSPSLDIPPWGSYSTVTWQTPEILGMVGGAASFYVRVTCDSTSDLSKLPTVFVDNWSVTVI